MALATTTLEVGLGTMITLAVTWRVPATAAGTLTDPTTVVLKVRDPAGVTTTYTYPAAPIVKDAAGSYHADYVPAVAGTYVWRWEGVGVAHAAAEGVVRVAPSGL
jgi:hypothetical protein